MSDFNSSLPIRTENDGDVVIKVGDGLIPSQQLTVNPDGSVNITDNSGSLTVDATDLDIRDLAFATDSVDVSGSDITATVTATDLDIRDLVFATDKVDVTGSEVSLDATTLAALENITVSATDFDIRDLVFATDKVDVTGSDVTATVTATDLDIRDLVFATDKVDVSDSVIALDAATLAALENTTVTVDNAAGAAAVNIQDGGNSITVDATNLDIRDLTHASDSVKIGDGTDFLAINTDGSINVVPLEDNGTETVDYNTAAALAGGATSNHDLVFASASKLFQVYASASGKLKIEVQVETGAATGTFNTVMVAFNSTATPNIDATLSKYALIPAGARVRVIRTNKDNQAQDVYSTIVGILGL